jgi:hypothetical protein
MNIVLSAVIVFFLMYLGGGVMRARQRRSDGGEVPPIAGFRGEIYGSGILGRRRDSYGRSPERTNSRPTSIVPPEQAPAATAALPARATS